MSLAARLKRNILKVTRTARTTSTHGQEAIDLMKTDPHAPGAAARNAEQRAVIRAYLERLPFFRRRATPEQLLDFCSFGVATVFSEGEPIVQLGDEAVFMLMLRGKADVMRRTNLKVPQRVLFVGDWENEGYLIRNQAGGGGGVSQNSPVAINSTINGTVVLRMSRAWLTESEFLAVCRAVGIDLRDPVYDKTTFLGRLPPRSIERLLRRSRLESFSAHKTVFDVASSSSLSSASNERRHVGGRVL